MNRQDALQIVDKYITDKFTRLHLLESEAIMKTLAHHFGEDENLWGIIGLLHDIDWDITKNDVKNHCVKMKEILKSEGVDGFIIDTIESHNFGRDGENDSEYRISALSSKRRSSRIQHSLAAAETLTGLIIAAALVQPDKKLASVTLESLQKKFRSKNFAARCNREIIMEIEKTALNLDEFLSLGLKALQEIHEEIGL